jgi:hypothetical protein
VRRGQLDERKDCGDDRVTIYGADDAEEAESVAEVLRRHTWHDQARRLHRVSQLHRRDAEIDRQFQELRVRLRDATQVCCDDRVWSTVSAFDRTASQRWSGHGRVLSDHCERREGLSDSREPYTFTILKQAQALGDFRALVKRGRRVIGIDLGNNTSQVRLERM